MDRTIELDIFARLDALWQRFDLLAEKRKTMSDMDFVVEQVNIKKSIEDCFERLQDSDIEYKSYKIYHSSNPDIAIKKVVEFDKALKKAVEFKLDEK